MIDTSARWRPPNAEREKTMNHSFGLVCPTRLSLVIGLAVSLCFFAVANYVHFRRQVTCVDCFFPYGLPFTLFTEGGFAGGGGVVWAGMVGDFLAVLAFGAAAAWILEWLTSKTGVSL
jgi:hypothetical protein